MHVIVREGERKLIFDFKLQVTSMLKASIMDSLKVIPLIWTQHTQHDHIEDMEMYKFLLELLYQDFLMMISYMMLYD